LGYTLYKGGRVNFLGKLRAVPILFRLGGENLKKPQGNWRWARSRGRPGGPKFRGQMHFGGWLWAIFNLGALGAFGAIKKVYLWGHGDRGTRAGARGKGR